MADTEQAATTATDGGPSEKEANKADSPKPDQEVAPPLISTSKPEKDAETKQQDKKKPGAAPARRGAGPAGQGSQKGARVSISLQPGGDLHGHTSDYVRARRQSMVKKNVVMSSEAMKEMAKQAKANRDERKTAMDSRHAFMFSSLAEALNMELSQVEDFLLGDDKFDMIGEFFAQDGPRKLMFFYQEATSRDTLYSRTDTSSVITQPTQKKLFLTTGTSEGLNGMCYFFLRSTNKAITPANIAAEVNFGMMDCTNGKILQGFKMMLDKIMMPALKLQENWGEIKDESQVSDFFEQLEKFVGSLGTATSNMDGRVQLCEHEYLETMLDSLKTAADFTAAASVPDTVEKLEELSMMWLKQIVQVLTESEQMRKEADDIGPAAELDHWKKRMSKFNSLLDQIKSPRCKAVVGVLIAAKSKVLKQWKELDRRITDAANEAKDNVKYLYTLDKFFGPLVKCDPSAMIEHIPSLMNAIRMIHSISRYYNTSERMTSLFVKVTNQMITTCKAYIKRDVTKIWDHERPVLLKRLNDCIKLNEEYQKSFHRTKERLKETPEERQFEFSENYIFGKFDTFCRRLTRIADLVNTMESLSGLADVKIEGIDSLYIRFQGIVATHKKKSYDILDHRKGEFDQDYMDFRSQIDSLHNALQNFVDSWFEKPLTTDQALVLLSKFEKIKGANLNLNEKYMRVLSNYGRDQEMVRKLYQKGKEDPPIMRNIPPVAGKIVWCRQLFRKIEHPMRAFKAKPEILKTNEAKKLIRNYNKMATVLLEYEVLYHRGWFRAVDNIRSGLQASLLVRHPETKVLYVNFDPQVFELIAEAKYMGKLGLEIPEAAGVLVLRETEIKGNYVALVEMLNEYDRIVGTIPNILLPLMTPFRDRVEEALQPGLTSLNWTSLSLDQYISNTYKEIHFLQHQTKQVCDLLECRIDDVLKDMATTALCDLPVHEPTSTTEFLASTERTCQEACDQLTRQSQAVEASVKDLVEILVGNLRENEKQNLQGSYPCLHPDSKHKRCLECLPCCFYTMLGSFSQRNTDALIKCTRLSLDTIKKRLQIGTNKYTRGASENEEAKVPLFQADIILSIPSIVLQPSLDDIQSTVNKAVQVILKMAQNIPQWEQTILSQKAALKAMLGERKELEESKDDKDAEKVTLLAITQKPLHKVIAEHKDVLKVVIALNNIVGNFKIECQDILNEFTHFAELWTEDPAEKVKEFMDTKPLMSEIESQMRYYQGFEIKIEEIPASYRVGSVICLTERLKTALVAETKAWKVAFGRALNSKASADMEEIFDFIEDLQKRLSRPIKDLDDVRAAMAALTEIRESEIRIDMTISPIEESYALLNKYELIFSDGNAEKVDSLSYNWKNLTAQFIQVADHLVTIQPEFKGDLLSGVTVFQQDATLFVEEYTEKGPMVQGIAPREASDRLQLFQARFDELWAKYITYSGGEELFGLPVTEYPDLQRIKKEFNLLQKLYGLYNAVIEKVNGYYDIPWVDVDIEKINGELQDFQNKCRKLPKALKEWQAFMDLKKKIDDFSECCPLLEMMANKAMMTRHWDRIANLTAHTFDVESDTFLLRNIMTAPLLPNKEDIEDICISAVKEKDIEAKLKQVVAEWSVQDFQFGSFKTRGELMLKGDTTGEIISMMEDSLMVLASLMSNRYNAPFKPEIQKWVQRLSNTTEIIENWMQVQNLWVYLEAVFVGGDIAKQLPQEAKRFSNIDKSWVKIMQRAHENTNVVGCCVGDDTLSQLLPHLLEQLEICQKSLTGYLEKKRLVFPRFFFVSDPALLEILGQASDSHTIQAHLEGLFDNVKTVDFHEKNYDQILAISSREKEKIDLVTPVNAQGNVEVWLGDLLKTVKKSIHTVIRTSYIALQDKENFNLIEYENTYAAQVGLLGIQMIWTRDSEEALKNARSDRKIMATTNQYFLDMLNMLIDMTTQELTKYERTKFETLVTIHVHQRDIFDDLVRMHIKSVNDFEWLKQSRFYFNEDTDACIISITDVDFAYMNEPVGCTDRLVITPLTDRCYITLAQALGMSMGGAPAGPAGTGKTETTKDMGKALGKYVVVFNCSDQMDFRGLGRIYKGLAQSGSWGCFDEFNRIELPVLSVAAQQIYIVLTCKKERKNQFVFTDGDIVDMDPEFGIFLTMNPGYAGRQELPENLKIQFRTVAMMVPDRQIIMRVKLASCGFQGNVILARKFYTLYKLCEEQLTKQVHYDFGLRNILSVLRTLGAFKRSNPQDSENMIVMRVLRDMNLSKLVDEDEPLFLSLIDDLFPGMTLDKAGYPEIEAAIEKQIREAGLVHHPPWTLKLIQLFETQRVRHGMMTLGPSGAGKTKCIHTLMKAMGDCGAPHREMRMNPKAITAPQMFGRLDVATNDWTDGIFSTLWRKTLKAKKGEHIWIVLDGPVDAIWIENLNSVLDDNKTLTLANGDRIPMSPNCKVIFEPHNIDNASPATVSRNGMVYMSSSIMDWQPILQGWLFTRPATQQELLMSLFESTYKDLYLYVIQSLVPKMEVLECMYVRQTIDLLSGLIPGEDSNPSREHLERLYIFCLMWSLGALLELDDRKKMEAWLVERGGLLLPKTEPGQTIFEFVVRDDGQWEHWSDRVPEYIYPTDSTPEYSSILVPNVDNVCTDYLIHTIAKQEKAVLLIGEQGTAKTVVIKGYSSKYDPEHHLFKSLNFSSATTPNMFQRTIESYVDKRVGTTYGPPAGKKMTVFVDDVNMPVINEWGDQITNEIVRQLMGTKGFYSLEKPGEFTSIVDIQFLAAMIQPGGGRNDIPQRLKRQYNIFNCTLPSNNSIDKIFSTVGTGHYCKEREFNAEVCQLAASLVSCTRKLWQRTKIKMLPTPAKFHYIFNLRDLSRIWEGMLNSDAEVISNTAVLLGLWKHECTRVIADRFVSQEDKDWFEKTIKHTIEEDLGTSFAEQLPKEPLFVDFLRDAPEITGEEPDDADLDAPKIYEPIPSLEALADRLTTFQDMYNETVRGAKMDLVFFKDAMCHLLKISRVIRTKRGNALLVGVGGSGKQSLTKLASFIAGYKSFQITLSRSYNVTNLMEDLKYLYRVAGQQGQGITFIFTDNEIKDEAFLEYMNNVIASGEVSNLFARDEIDEITGELISVMKKEYPRRPPTNENLYDYFLMRVRNNLHVVLCFSPVGEKFRNRSLKFPGLFSGCTMDWFSRWPKDALIAVAQHFLASFPIVCSDNVKKSVVNTMGVFQDLVAETCVDYFQRFRRQTHVTPKSYLSFIDGYKKIYSEKKAAIGMLADRMKTGLDKLVEATASVNELSKELAVKEKELAVASKKADAVLAEVTVSAQAAEKVKAQVQKVKDKAQAIVDEINVDKQAAETKLDAAKPALAQAEASLNTIKPAHISTVRKLAKPPHLIMRIMDCVLLLFQRRLEPCQLDPERPCPKPSWGDALRLMGSSSFLQTLMNFPKDTINEETVELLQPYLLMEDYNLETAKRVCGDVAGLCSWTEAMAFFYGINKEVLPLKANLVVQEARLTKANASLAEAQAQLDEKQRELDLVQAKFDAAMGEKQALLDDAESCRRKMNNATALISGLGGERVRWTEASKRFEDQINRLVGDVLLGTGFLSYSGPFNQEFRNLLIRNWKREMASNKIPYSDELNLTALLVDSTTIGEWNLQGLPNDELSIQNGIIVTKASRFPLLIDPQGQGKAWIREKEKSNELQMTSLNHKYFRTHLEDSLSLGRPLLIEDVGEELDPALDNVLEKNFIKSGSTYKVKVGDKECDVDSKFIMYITTKLANPAYTPEISARTSIIDFTVTMKGLEDQLLGIVILTEKQELEAERTKLMEEVTANKRKMQELEDNLLYRLTSTEGSLVEDESLIEVLRVTKITAEEVSEKLTIAAETELRINTAREEFRPVATRGSTLYFLITEMSMVNVMYQTSLKQFLGLFDLSMARSQKSPITAKRIANIIDFMTYEVFKYTARGLYENHKFLFTLLLTLKIDMQLGKVKHDEFQTFIKGGAALDLNTVDAKPKKWILDTTWLNLVQLSKLPQFTQLLGQVSRNDKAWKNWFDEDAPEEATIPDGYSTSLDVYRKLLLVRSWCPDRAIPQARKYIADSIGVRYAEGVILNLETMWEESEKKVPLICFLSMGSDPTASIESLAKKMNLRCRAISMGQGQEVHARRLLSSFQAEGGWVLLQNCHLGLGFMDELLETVTTTEPCHDSFRLWITTEVHPKFPINLLQSGIKFTNEPPQGIKAGLKRTYAGVSQEQLEISNLPQWKPVLYGVAFLHTTVQERRKFGPLGWNIPYEFNQADFTASVQFVNNHLDDLDPKKGISWNTVRYMFGEVQYGGRVTDDYDKRLLNTYCKVWFSEDMFSDKFKFYTGYTIPKCRTVEEYRTAIDSLPLTDSPEAFGLHPNADITFSTNMATEVLETILNIQPKDSGGGGGETREATVYKICDDMLSKLPDDFIPHEVKARLQKMGHLQPLNIFLRQEIDRMQRVISTVRITLQDLKLAIDGTIIMSENLRDALDNMFDARVPGSWKKISWDSMTLGFWFTELIDRHAQFHAWCFDGRPNVFWMTGFFNPQGFLTAMRQEITRAHKGWALDSVVLHNDMTRYLKEDISSPPAEGVYIHGLFLDGAGWDRRNCKLIEPPPKVLFTPLPVCHVYAINTLGGKDPRLYECPVYKKPRRTDLTYIFPLYLKTVQHPDHWILRGVALLCDTK
ncbi:dynein heavy chain 5, axonemal-like [Lytechinus variegatus]|uniref:dynein heavy chain 5, axonemal-like n=1 Tax=Lytechinus variegatus TaxID=7654 RepID=UPI001BB11057|nr:dynein heavy chain 5, axonemal-like isoform X2 [Lytechinus variegatus]XP_041462936.1 dynein heavy chain 5, axonemal-like [Lytechinus variegatus]